jgi:FtsP/CotA-like multicopper oxidase with cupredoxin domain
MENFQATHIIGRLRQQPLAKHCDFGKRVIHPRDPQFMRVDRDFVFLLSSYLIDPGSYLPKVTEMTDFNLWAFNTRVFPGIDHLAVSQGDRVRVRVGNLTMTNHPIHMHGYHFSVTCTDGGWVPESARWPETTIDVPVGAMRAYESSPTCPATGRSTVTSRITP